MSHRLREESARLAAQLAAYRDERPFVLAIPRGGVEVAEQIARALRAPLDVLLASKVMAPGLAGVAVGAVAEGGVSIVEHRGARFAGVPSAAEVERLIDRERQRLDASLERIRGSWPLPQLPGRCVILVDDAVVSGLTMRAAIAAVRGRHGGPIVVATPLCSTEAAAALTAEAVEVVYLASAPAPIAERMHGGGVHEPCPPISDAQIHDVIVQQLRRVGVDPFGDVTLDGA